MKTCQCDRTDFVDSPLLHNDTDEKGSYVGQVYSRIAYRTEEVQTISKAWAKVERFLPRSTKRKIPNNQFGKDSRTYEERRAQREKDFYDSMTDEGKAWHDAAGRWPDRFNHLKSNKNSPKKTGDEEFHLLVSLRLKMCTSCGASTIYSTIDEHNRCIDALLPLAQQKLASVVVEEKVEEQAKERVKHERRVAEEKVNELEKQLADAKKAHDRANELVGDGKKNLSSRRRNMSSKLHNPLIKRDDTLDS